MDDHLDGFEAECDLIGEVTDNVLRPGSNIFISDPGTERRPLLRDGMSIRIQGNQGVSGTIIRGSDTRAIIEVEGIRWVIEPSSRSVSRWSGATGLEVDHGERWVVWKAAP